MMYNKNYCDKIQKYSAIIIFSSLIFLFILFCINIIENKILVNSYNELTDFTLIRAQKIIYNLKNPYTLDNLEKEIPFMYLYTPLMPLFSAFATFVFRTNALLSCYIVNLFFVILTIINNIIIVKEKIRDNVVLYCEFIILIVFTFFSMMGLPIFNLRPDIIAIYVFTLIFLTLKTDYNNTNLLTFLSILQAFTKQIIFIQTLSIIIFLLLVDKKIAKEYIIKMFVFGILTIFVIFLFFPLYWSESTYTLFFIDMLYGTFADAIKNVCQFYIRYILFVFFIIIGIIKLVKNSDKKLTIKSLKVLIEDNKMISFLIINIILSTLSLLYFAKTQDDGYKYCQDFLAPSILILFFYLLEYILQVKIIKKYFHIMLTIIVFVTLAQFRYDIYTSDDIKEYNILKEDINKFNGERILLGKVATNTLVDKDYYHNKNIYYDDGHIEFYYCNTNDYPMFYKLPFTDALYCLPYMTELHNTGVNYHRKLTEMVRNQEFQFIVTCVNRMLDEDLLKEKYDVYNTYTIKTDVKRYTATSWIPKK